MRSALAVLLLSSVATAAPTRDIDGDGFDDAVLDHRTLIYGSPKGPAIDTKVTPSSPRQAFVLFYAVEVVGDVDGDGFADVVLGDPACPDFADDLPPCETGAIHLFRGGPKRLAAKPSQTLRATAKNTMFGNQIVALGDVDGDRRADIAVVARDGVHIYFGGPKGLSPTPRDLPGNANVVALGDIDGDQRADLALVETSRATIYFGADPARTQVVTPPKNTTFYGAAGHGDFDGDGHDDLAITIRPVSGARLANQVAIYRGGAKGLAGTPQTRLARGGARDEFGGAFAAVGDLDGDKRDDLVIVATCARFTPKWSSCDGAAAYVWLGGPRGLRPVPAATLAPVRKNTSITGGGIFALGDIDHDGHPDFAFGAYVYRGGKGGVVDRKPPSL